MVLLDTMVSEIELSRHLLLAKNFYLGLNVQVKGEKNVEYGH